jgi:RNA polymerase sigma-70 factor, ECF subfamily
MIGPSFPGLLAAAQGGDEQAFAVLWRDLQPAVLRYLRVAAPVAAEDLAADTWVSVIRGLARFTGDEQDFRAWVFTAARHRAIDWRRQAARQPVGPLPLALAVEHFGARRPGRRSAGGAVDPCRAGPDRPAAS